MSELFKTSSSAYYVGRIDKFLAAAPEAILGVLASNTTFSVDANQRDAWLGQIQLLRSTLVGVQGAILFEFIVPRIGSRIDVVLISGPVIFVLEFKVGEKDINREDLNQVWDYALDLKNFHKASHSACVVPILVATQALHSDVSLGLPHVDHVFPPAQCNADGLRHLILLALGQTSGQRVDPDAWLQAPLSADTNDYRGGTVAFFPTFG